MKLYAFLNNTVNKHFRESDALHGLRDNVGYANGYVAVPPEHPLHGVNYNDVDNIEVHGGLTFSNSMEEIKADGWHDDTECIGFDSFDDIPKDYWVFGFDTAHAYDNPTVWNRETCIEETKYLKEQLENIKEL